MNESIHLDGAADVPWPTSGRRVAVPDTSMLPGSEKAAPAVVGLLNQATQGAHDTIDRLADSAAPAARQLDERVTAAGAAIHAKADRLRATRDEWAEGARTKVRGNPLVSIAAAVALGALIVRIVR